MTKNAWMCFLSLTLFLAADSYAITQKVNGQEYGQVPQKNAETAEGKTLQKVLDPEVRSEQSFKFGVQEFSLIATEKGYLPNRIIVRKNIPVRLFLVGASAKSLCFVLDDFAIKKGLSSQAVEEIRFLPTQAGQHKFFCPVDGLEGTLVVRE